MTESDPGITAGKPARDLSRAHWQRSVGSVITREFSSPYYQQFEEVLEKDGMLANIAHMIAYYETFRGIREPWSHAHAVASYMGREDMMLDTNELMEEQTAAFTHTRSVPAVMEEGMSTLSRFPINMAYSISTTARDRGVSGFDANKLSDIATILRRVDFRKIIDQAATTKNSFWESYSTAVKTSLKLDFEFHEGQVSFPHGFTQLLHDEIVAVNRRGLSREGPVEIRASAGCPARYLKPHFRSTPDDQLVLEALSAHFSKSPEDLTRKHEQSVIDEGLDVLARVLEKAEPLIADLPKDGFEGLDTSAFPVLSSKF